MTPPTVAVVGYSNSGKTRVASSLVSMLSSQGFRTAFIKHCHHAHDVDNPGTDTERIRMAGAAVVIASSPGNLTRMEYGRDDLPLESIVNSFRSDIDLVVAEGFKYSSFPKVLVVGNGSSPPDVENVIAVVSDHPREWDLPTYGFDQLDILGSYLRREFLDMEPAEHSVSLVVDGVSIPLKQFPTSALAGIIKGFVSSLHGVPEEPFEIQITVRNKIRLTG